MQLLQIFPLYPALRIDNIKEFPIDIFSLMRKDSSGNIFFIEWVKESEKSG